jgi:hypothetical protein
MSSYDLIVIGGGAAGIFAALAAKNAHPQLSVLILEKTAVLLSKVKVSGGGRCNVTHACFDPKELVKNYPRGSKELLGPFHRFQPRDTIEWFETRNVFLKTESDGRMFPITDRSETIIECLLSEAKKLGIEIRVRTRVQTIRPGFVLELQEGEVLQCKKLVLATGSSGEGHAWAEGLGHTIQKPVPSLFTFNVPTSPLKELSGIAFAPVKLEVEGLTQTGPLLITHFGFSGPAALKLSAWAARPLFEKGYKAPLTINWLPSFSIEEIIKQLKTGDNPFKFPKNLWKALSGDLSSKSNKQYQALAEKLHADVYAIDGKTTHKEEFVTCGGVTLKEVDFKTMQSKICPGLFFAGEILDIDGVTGGFNFQNAWTTAFIAGASLEGQKP